MASNEGYSNLASAIIAFLGGRYKARKERQKEERTQAREDKRAKENRDFLKEMEGIRGGREAGLKSRELDIKQEAMDRAFPKKGFLDKVMDTVTGMVKGPSPQDQESLARAGLLRSQAGLIDRTPRAGTGMQFPGNPRMPRTKAEPQPTSSLVAPEKFFQDAAKNIITGVMSGYRRTGRQFDPASFDWSSLLKMKRGQISKVAGRDLSDQELSIIQELIQGSVDDQGNKIPGLAEGFFTQTLPQKKKMKSFSGSAR